MAESNGPNQSSDPEILLIAWRGTCSQLAAQYGMPLEILKRELNQLPRYKLKDKLLFNVNSPRATNQFLAAIQSRRLKSTSD